MPNLFTNALDHILDKLQPAVVAVDAKRNPDRKSFSVFVREGDHFRRHELAGPETHLPNHIFTDLEDFAVYVNTRASKKADVDVVFGDGEVFAGFDPFLHEGVEVQCKLKSHPMWDAWTKVLGKNLSQRQLHEHLIAFGEVVAGGGPDKPGPLDELVTGLQTLEINRSGSFSSQLAASGHVKLAANESKQDLSVNLPTKWSIIVPRYEGILAIGDVDGVAVEAEAVYELPILLRTEIPKEGGKPTFVLMAPSRPLVESHAEKDVGRYLRHLLDDQIFVGNGGYQTQSVPLRQS